MMVTMFADLNAAFVVSSSFDTASPGALLLLAHARSFFVS